MGPPACSLGPALPRRPSLLPRERVTAPFPRVRRPGPWASCGYLAWPVPREGLAALGTATRFQQGLQWGWVPQKGLREGGHCGDRFPEQSD